MQAKARALAPKDTGAMAAAIQVRSTTRKIKQATGRTRTVIVPPFRQVTVAIKRTAAEEFGAKAEITRTSLAKQMTKRGRGKYAEKLLGDTKSFFYPAAFEFGTRGKPPSKPFRLAMVASENETLQAFISELRKLLLGVKKAASKPPRKLSAEGLPDGFKFDKGGRLRDAAGKFVTAERAAELGIR